MTWLLVFAFVEIFLLYLCANFTKMDIISPGFVTITMFLIATLCVIHNVEYWNVNFSNETCFVMSSGLIAVVITEYVVKYLSKKRNVWKDAENIKNEKPIVVSEGTWLICATFSIVGSLFYVISVMKTAGVMNVLAISIVRFNEELNINIVAKMCYRILKQMPYPFLFIMIHNVVLCKESIKRNGKYVVPIICSCIATFFSGSRGPYLYILLALFVYYVMFYRYRYGRRKGEIKKVSKKMIIAIIALIIVFVGTREIVKGTENRRSGLEYIEYYIGSPIHLFDKIVENPNLAYPENYGLPGAHTFALFWQDMYNYGIVNEFLENQDGRYIGIGGNFIGIGNVYTFFSAPFIEFGYWGMIIFVILFYCIANFLYYKKIINSEYIGSSYGYLIVFGYSFNYIFMTFFKITTAGIKMQTVFEGFVMYLIFVFLKKIKISFDKKV